MSDTASNGQSDRSGSDASKSGSSSAAPFTDDQPTVITNRPPITPPGYADSKHRIELGQLAPGDMVEHFELLEFVGGGGMGRVFRAMDTQLSRVVALKVLPREQSADQETLQRFQNEAKSAARLDHDCIARVHYVGEDHGLPYIVFEYVEGLTIRAIIEQQGPLPLSEAVSYALQIAEALGHAAERSVVHRDVKPSNVLITSGGRVKVIDMGLARLQQCDEPASDLTASGVTLGTFDYISPEQARDPRAVDVRSDIYSLGCTFFYMLAGRPPFPEGTVLQKLLQHQGDEPPDIHEFRPDLPEEVTPLLRKMLAKDRQRRFQDTSELIDQLKKLAERVGLFPIGGDRQVWAVPRAPRLSLLRRHLPWMAPVAALVGIVFFLNLYDTRSTRQATQTVDKLVGGSEKLVAELPVDVEGKTEKRLSNEEKSTAVAKTIGPTADSGGAIGGSAGDTTAEASFEITDNHKNGEPSAVPASNGNDEAALQFGPLMAELEALRNAASKLTVASQPQPKPAEITLDNGMNGKPAAMASKIKPSKRSGVLVVTDDADGFATLSAACNAASTGDVVELRFNGRREEKPISLPNKKITIRAADGFRPVIAFRPNELDPIKYPRSMFTLTGSRLTLLNVAIVLDIPRDVPAEQWSLLKMGRSDTVKMEKCCLTICNASDQLTAYHQEVAFFHVGTTPSTNVIIGKKAKATERAAKIELTDTIARGEAVLLRAEDLQPAELTWTNGLLVTTEWLVTVDGGEKKPQDGEMITLDLRHLTAVVRAGLCHFGTSQFALNMLPVRINCSDSIVMIAPDGILIDQIGSKDVGTLLSQVDWSGDRNFYKGFNTFWQIRPFDGTSPVHQMSLSEWKTHWGPERENMALHDEVWWKKLSREARPTHTHTPSDYILSDSRNNNRAIDAASDGSDIGFDINSLSTILRQGAKKNVHSD